MIDYINRLGMALTLFSSSVGWDEIRTYDLLIMILICYSLDQTFAQFSYSLFILLCNYKHFQNTLKSGNGILSRGDTLINDTLTYLAYIF